MIEKVCIHTPQHCCHDIEGMQCIHLSTAVSLRHICWPLSKLLTYHAIHCHTPVQNQIMPQKPHCPTIKVLPCASHTIIPHSIGTIVRLTHQRHTDHRTPEYDARSEYVTREWHSSVYSIVCTWSMTPKYVLGGWHANDTKMTPTPPPPSDTSGGRSVRRLPCKSPTTKPTSEMQGYKKTITELPGQPPNSEKKVQKYPQTTF